MSETICPVCGNWTPHDNCRKYSKDGKNHPNTPSVLTEEQVEGYNKICSEREGCIPIDMGKRLIATIESLWEEKNRNPLEEIEKLKKERLVCTTCKTFGESSCEEHKPTPEEIELKGFKRDLSQTRRKVWLEVLEIVREKDARNLELQGRVKELEKGIKDIQYCITNGTKGMLEDSIDDLLELLTNPEDELLIPPPPPPSLTEREYVCRYCRETIVVTSKGIPQHEIECAREKGMFYNALR